MGTVGAACHRVGVNLWWISGFPGEAAEQATLAYLPRLLLLPADPGKGEDTQRVCRAARQTMRRLLGVAVAYALVLVAIMLKFTKGERLGWLTTDAQVLAQTPTEIISLASLFVAPTLVLEGTLFAFFEEVQLLLHHTGGGPCSMLNDGWFRTLHWTCQLCPKDLLVLHPVVCHPAVSGQRIHQPVDHAQAFSATCRRTNVTLGGSSSRSQHQQHQQQNGTR